MCAGIIIGDQMLESQGAVKVVLGDLIYSDDAPNGAKNDDDGCLCWVNVTAMAERENMIATWDGMDWVLALASTDGRER
jgi:hypothetical protein